MPLGSVVVHAKTSDSQMLLPSLKRMKELDIQLPNLVDDMGYIDGQKRLKTSRPQDLKTYHTTVFTEVKKDMIRPEVCDEQGRVFCPEVHLAVYAGFDTEDMIVQYVGDKSHCDSCLRWGPVRDASDFLLRRSPKFSGHSTGIATGKVLSEFRKQAKLCLRSIPTGSLLCPFSGSFFITIAFLSSEVFRG